MASPPNDEAMESSPTRTPAEARFLEWLTDHGAEFPKIAWPTVTPNGLRGATARADIATNEAMVIIPACLMISEATCWADETLRRVYSENRDLFSRDDPVLVLFLVREMAKESASFYYPYLSILPEVRTVQDWTPAQLAELQDATLVDAAARRTAEMNTCYAKIMRRLGDKYPGEFPPEEYTLQRFQFAWKTVQARTFGRRLPWTALVPFADCLNHTNVATKYDFDVDHNGVFRLYPSGTNRYMKDCEVFNSYGRRPNFQLLLDYGFALPDNEWDYVDLELPKNTAQIVGTRFPYRKRLRLEVATTLDTVFPLQHFPHDPAGIPTTGDLKSRRQVLEWFLGIITNAINDFGTSIEANEALLQAGDLSECMWLAVTYRLGRMRILDRIRTATANELLECVSVSAVRAKTQLIDVDAVESLDISAL